MTMPENCERCGKPIEKDGFCSKFGPHFEQWLCDDCVELENDYWEQENMPHIPEEMS